MNTFATAQLWVNDQDEALAFYVDQLGWTVREDLTPPELGGFRWLTVAPKADSDTSVVLMAIPGEPVFSEETAASVRDLLAKGAVGAIFLTTDDVQAEYEALKARGVDLPEPTQQPWGIDTGFRDPSGNHIRLAQRVDIPAAV
ncbi:VOC family protein [Solirubrobacter soli]|uniref:VOC family protein n=1 Tax=Solirubrobacter soli TaxID=363832 RepID=UPI0004041DB1|nr:VOC family protein [Solirubrobacter soli]